MPKHDLPDGHEPTDNLIDFRAHLRRRVTHTLQDNGDSEPESSDWEIFQRAEYGDGKRPKFSRYDLLWIGMILVIGYVFWSVFRT